MAQCVVFQCLSCGHKENVAREEYEKTEKVQQPSLKTMSGATIIYRPVPDSFVCPKCKGDMILNNCVVTEPLDGVIMVAPIYEDVKKVNEEELRRQEAEGNHKRRQQALTILAPTIERNLRHLERMEGTELWEGRVFHTEPADRPRIARCNALTSFVAQATKWSCEDAQIIAVNLLEEANLHEQARQVKQLLEDLEKKGY